MIIEDLLRKVSISSWRMLYEAACFTLDLQHLKLCLGMIREALMMKVIISCRLMFGRQCAGVL